MFLAQATQDPLIPTGSELILGIVCFAIVFGILGKMLLPRITKTLNEREDAIQGGINRADEAQAVLNQYRAQLEDAKHEAARMREEAREAGAQIIAEMRERAEAEARRITESAQSQIEAGRQEAVASLP